MSVFYVYIWDAAMGGGFIKICTYKARAVNAFLLETETAGQDTVLVSPSSPAAALDTLDQLTAEHITRARVPTVA